MATIEPSYASSEWGGNAGRSHVAGNVEVEGIKVMGTFIVMDSGGGWEFLLGRPLLKSLRATHNHWDDTVTLESEEGEVVKIKSCPDQAMWSFKEKPVLGITPEGIQGVFTRFKTEGPFFAPRVKKIQEEVVVGEDLSEEQQGVVRQLVAEFADIFALSVSEVNQVPGAVHHLKVPEGVKFPIKVHQRPYSPPQKAFLNKKVDELLQAEIIEPIHPRDVKFAAPTVLAKKTHETGGLSRIELLRKVERECIKAGYEPVLEPRENDDFEEPTKPSETLPAKWRVCHNFVQLNNHTEVAPMPQGDIRDKQQRLSGHRWISTFDFASRFYGIALGEESKPYICFYVEGRGYFAYKRMPFGLTGAPSEFAHLTATHLHDLVMESVLEIFVDDGGLALNDFNEGIGKLRKVFQRARE